MASETSPIVVRRVIAQTFGVPETSITSATTADDVDGWDSLSHTILMIRLGRTLGLCVPEAIAADAQTVGSLADAIAGLRG